MPRTRLVWHLFAGWCGLVVALLGGFFWLSSVQLARLADDAGQQRLVDAALGLARTATTADGGIDVAAFEDRAREAGPTAGVTFELFTADGRPHAAADTEPAATGDPRLVA